MKPPEDLIGRLRALGGSLWRSARRRFFHLAVRALMVFHALALRAAAAIGRRAGARPTAEGLDFLITGTFYSDNWLSSHLRPLAASSRCRAVYMVAARPVPPIPKVTAIYPPRWLIRTLGGVPARLVAFAWAALRMRPHVVGGFHLLVNGLAAAVLARLVGARSLYFCVGGPKEVVDGGIGAENRLFGKMETPDRTVERRLLQAVAAFDLVIAMGTRAVEFFRQKGIRTAFHVVSGGIEGKEFSPSGAPREFDLVLVGRLVEIKRVDVFLRSIELARARRPGIRAAIVGDGKLRAGLERLAGELGLRGNITFAGHQREVGDWLRRSKLFVLTSDSEGLSLALMEAMMCGLPAVVSRVGDLPDLVEEGVNGYLVERRRPEEFARRILDVLASERSLEDFSLSARRAALRHESAAVALRWDEILDTL